MARAAIVRRSLSVNEPVERRRLSGGAHADRNDRSKERCRDRKARSLRDAVHLAHDFDSQSRSHQAREEIREGLIRTFHAGRNDPRSDDGSL